MSVVPNGSNYYWTDIFLNEGEFFSYQIPTPSNLDSSYELVSANLTSNVWWDNPDPQWLSVTNDGLLQGTAAFGYEERDQGYNILLEYSSPSNTININEFFQVFVNSYVEANHWSKDFAYHLNYDFDNRDVFAKSVFQAENFSEKCFFENFKMSESLFT